MSRPFLSKDISLASGIGSRGVVIAPEMPAAGSFLVPWGIALGCAENGGVGCDSLYSAWIHTSDKHSQHVNLSHLQHLGNHPGVAYTRSLSTISYLPIARAARHDSLLPTASSSSASRGECGGLSSNTGFHAGHISP